MTESSPIASAEELPRTLPIFPLSGVLLLPRGRLPLNIFEPRYLAMIGDAMASAPLVGIVQPMDSEQEGNSPEVYKIGCVGHITSFKESDDGRYLITLTGVCRFDVGKELPVMPSGYRRVRAHYNRYIGDFIRAKDETVDCSRLKTILRAYFQLHGIDVNWNAMENATGEGLVTSLAMICPFAPSEKQAILETRHFAERIEVITALMEMAVLARVRGDDSGIH